MSLDPALLLELEGSLGLPLRSGQRDQLSFYVDLLLRWNRKINLTSVTNPAELLRFHFFEAFWGASTFLPTGCRVADVGSGAGFPGLAMKLFRPDLQLVLIERNQKKGVFLSEVSRRMGLDVQLFQGPAEKYSGWSSVDVAVIRALKLPLPLWGVFWREAVRLLVFHGATAPLCPEAWQLERSSAFPLAPGRQASLFAPVDPGRRFT